LGLFSAWNSRQDDHGGEASSPDRAMDPPALLMDGVLKDAGILSLIQRAPGFDVPDFLSAGPRDVLVPGSLVEEAKQLLEDTTGLGSYAP
jgi:hypothetical protein